MTLERNEVFGSFPSNYGMSPRGYKLLCQLVFHAIRTQRIPVIMITQSAGIIEEHPLIIHLEDLASKKTNGLTLHPPVHKEQIRQLVHVKPDKLQSRRLVHVKTDKLNILSVVRTEN